MIFHCIRGSKLNKALFYSPLCLFSFGVDYLLCFAYFQDDFDDALQYDF